MKSEKTEEAPRFRQIFESSRDAIMLIGPDGYIDCNEATLRLFAVESKDKFKQFSPWELSPPTQSDGTDSKKAARKHIKYAHENGEDFFEWIHQREDGETFPSEVKLSRFELEGREILQALVRDITERKQRERELRKNKDRLNALLSNTPSVIYTYEVTDEIPETTYVSDSVKEVLGHEPEYYESDPENFLNDLHPEDSQELFEKEEKLLVDEDVDSIITEYRFKDKRGRYHWLRDEQKLLTDGDDFKEVIGTWFDITERKKQEEKLKRSNRQLQQFADKAAHDLKHPLGLITKYTDLLELENKDDLDKSSREYLEKINQKTQLVGNLLDRLVDYARLNSRQEEFGAVDLSAVVSVARENLQARIEESGAKIIYDDLALVEGDRTQLVRVFQNLIDNAIKYQGEENPVIEITSTSGQENCVEIIIKDNGMGIPPEQQDKIFNIFYQFQANEETEGTGVGLASCRKIIEQHGGEIEVESEPGKGSTFIFTLPAVEEENLTV